MEYGLIGEKLGHSYSKEIHELIGYYAYELKEIPRDGVDAFMKEKSFKGINVTIPYKEQVIPYLDSIDEGAAAIGAVNTIVNDDGKLRGYNTDFIGLKMLITHAGHNFEGSTVLILGTGGTSKTAMAVAKSLGAATVVKASRSGRDGAVTYEQAVEQYSGADFIINTTPSGMFPKVDEQPIDLTPFTDLKGVIDAIYNPMTTKLMAQAEALRVRADGGLRMLVYQAVVAAEYFAGVKLSNGKAEEIFEIIKERHMN